jgi:nitrogen fixation protein FixH
VRWVLALVAAAVLAVVAATIWVGTRTFEGTVVADPYDSAVRYDRTRHHAEALGWTLSVEEASLRVGRPPLRFSLAGKGGVPLEGAEARVRISRPGTAWQDRVAPARGEGGGRFSADVAFPEPGQWDVEVLAARGSDRLAVERRVLVER